MPESMPQRPGPAPTRDRREPAASRLPWLLAGLGVCLSAASGFYTYWLLHEQQESLGSAIVDHIASSKCTAINNTLSALSVARSDVLNGEPGDAHTQPGQAEIIGVVTPAGWRLEDFHSQQASAAEVVQTLQSLPEGAWQPAAGTAAAGQAPALPADLLRTIAPYRCPLRYGLKTDAVRIYAVRSPVRDAHAHHDHAAQPADTRPWLALLYGPWQDGAEQKTSFALFDLNAATLHDSGHDHELSGLFPDGSGRLAMEMELMSPALATRALTHHSSKQLLDSEDHKLLGLRIIPFANQVLRGELSVDHDLLDRVPRRTGALVFLLGLLATSCVVVISRHSELRLRGFNHALLRESRTDGLTGLANRRSWDEALQREEGRRQRYGYAYGILVIDLDGFKQINDQEGHAKGDAVLRNAADVMRAVIRDTDLLARVGGDEFTVLSLDPTSSGLAELVSRLRTALEQARIQASIGFAMSEPKTTLDQTWAKADASMYRSKGRSEVQSSPPPDGEPA